MILGFTVIESHATLKWPPILLVLGNASYSIYLIHDPVLSATQRIFAKMNFPWFIALIAGMIISITVGVIYHYIVEKQLIKFSKNILATRINNKQAKNTVRQTINS